MTRKNDSLCKSSEESIALLKVLLVGGSARTQEDLCVALRELGCEVNQTKISRLLRKVGAVKRVNTQGEVIYSIPREAAPPTKSHLVKDLVVNIVANEMLVIIFTSPGSASMIARILEYHQPATKILGAVAGDDTVFIAPHSVKQTNQLFREIKEILS